MSSFDSKWKTCAGRAREVPERDTTAPFGFATRVLAAAAAQPTEPVSLEVVWQRLTFRSLGLVGAVLVLCAVFELPHWHDRRPFEPGVENTVAQLVWTL